MQSVILLKQRFICRDNQNPGSLSKKCLFLMPFSPISGLFGKGTSPLNLHFWFISFLFEAIGLAGLWIDKDENIAVGGPCLAHKQVGTGSSAVLLITRWSRRIPAGAVAGCKVEPPDCAVLLCHCASPQELRTTDLMKSSVISARNTLFSHHPCPLGAVLICSLDFFPFPREPDKMFICCCSARGLLEVPCLAFMPRHIVPHGLAWPNFFLRESFPQTSC